jgi:hypothetical protein
MKFVRPFKRRKLFGHIHICLNQKGNPGLADFRDYRPRWTGSTAAGGAAPPAGRVSAGPPGLAEPFRSLRLEAGTPIVESRLIFIAGPQNLRLRDNLDSRG